MPQLDKAIYKQIDKILYYVWDPIGVNDSDPPQTSEYQSYTGRVYEAVKRGDSKQNIGKLLDSFITEDMGLDSQLQHCEEVAEMLLDWSKWQLAGLPNAAVFTTERVTKKEADVVRIVLDKDGDWQALDALPRSTEDSVVICLHDLLKIHPQLKEPVSRLDKDYWGKQAVKDKDGGWHVSNKGILPSLRKRKFNYEI